MFEVHKGTVNKFTVTVLGILYRNTSYDFLNANFSLSLEADESEILFVFTLTCQSGFSYSNRIPYLEFHHLTFNDGLISGWAKLF